MEEWRDRGIGLRQWMDGQGSGMDGWRGLPVDGQQRDGAQGTELKGWSSRDGWTEGSRWAWPSQREVFPFTTPSSSQLDGCAQIHVADPAPRGLGAAGPPGSPVQELPVLPAPAVPELLRVHPSHAVKV